MSINEFALIEKYFNQGKAKRKDVALGIGDDAALLKVPQGQQLAVTVDTLVENVHFLSSVKPEDLAWKSICVNVSDLAAMGAEPAWLTLSVTLPDTDKDWLKKFSEAFFECADFYGLQLIGGDTTKGPLSISIQAMGFVPEGRALTRSGAKPGDVIYATGTLGDAGLGLAISKSNHCAISELNEKMLVNRFNRPTPRVAEGMALREVASAAIDLSDGLIGDLQHLIKSSSVGAIIDIDDIPLSEALVAEVGKEKATQYALSAGDDYELCFVVAEENFDKLEHACKSSNCKYTRIGRITRGDKIVFRSGNKNIDISASGFLHFEDAIENQDVA